MNRRFTLILTAIILTLSEASAQQQSVDFMRQTGKIYVVVAVLATILLVLLAYLAWIDIKVRKIEKSIDNDRQES